MVNVKKLKGKLVECGMNVETVADQMGMDKATFYRRLANNGDTFTIGEADEISKILGLTRNEVNEIFFAQYVA